VHVAPWNDIHVRRALAFAVNRADLVRADGGYAIPLTTIILPEQLRLLGPGYDVYSVFSPSWPLEIKTE
jgi:peptide/nickel transport system substrate-binding protein